MPLQFPCLHGEEALPMHQSLPVFHQPPLKPAFADKFWPVRQMIKSWNDHMAGIFLCA
jgi:hypothetical protein